jgi:hypothetical protein
VTALDYRHVRRHLQPFAILPLNQVVKLAARALDCSNDA